MEPQEEENQEPELNVDESQISPTSAGSLCLKTQTTSKRPKVLNEIKLMEEDSSEVDLHAEIVLVEINDAKATSTLEMKLHTFYHDQSYLDPNAPNFCQKVNDYDGLVPKVVVEVEVDTRHDTFRSATRINHFTGEVYTILRNTVTLHQDFEYESFPFDYQRVHAAIWFENAKIKDFQPIENSIENCRYCIDSRLKLWSVVDSSVHRIANDEAAQNDLSLLVLNLYVARKPGFYLWSYCLPILILVWAHELRQGISLDQGIPQRVSITITVLLSVVAMKFVLIQRVPLTPNGAMLEFYFILALFTVLIPQIFEVIYWRSAEYESREDEIDVILGFSLGSKMIITLVAFYHFIIPYVPLTNCRTAELKKKATKKNEEYLSNLKWRNL